MTAVAVAVGCGDDDDAAGAFSVITAIFYKVVTDKAAAVHGRGSRS